jgi:cell division protein FtsB
MTNWAQILAILSFLVALISPFGVALAMRGSKLREEQAMAERVRAMYQQENELLQDRVERLEVDNKHLNKMMELIIDTLARVKGIKLEIEDSVVTLRDGPNTHRSRLSDTGPLPAV